MIDEDELRIGVLNMITADTGCGKTTWAADYLMRIVGNKNQMVYLIDIEIARDQLLHHDKRFVYYDKEWRRDVVEEMISFCDDRIVLMTYAKFGALTRYFPEIKSQFKVIICDELHSLPEFAAIPRKTNEQFNYAEDAIDALEEIINQTSTMVIGLTATPQKVYDRFDCGMNVLKLSDELRRYETMNTVRYRSLKELLLRLDRSKRGLLYVTQIHEVQNIVQFANANGYKAIGLWSTHAEDAPYTEEQSRVRDYLKEKREMPPQYNLFVMNAAYETSITIGGIIDYIIIHRNNEDTIVQARGRIRGDLQTLYLRDSNAEIIVPEQFLERPLSAEEREELASILSLENNLKWTGTKKRLIAAGYRIEEAKRVQSKRYYIIHNKPSREKICQN